MALSNTQIELLRTIGNRLQRGDIKKIAERTGVARENVGKALNMTTDFYNEVVVSAAVNVIREREENADKLLETLTAAV